MVDRQQPKARLLSGTQNLADLVDAPALQAKMDDFYRLTSIPTAFVDVEGEVIVGSGWQSVCVDFHRADPRTCAFCIESDTALTADIPPGRSKLYRCKNGMWDAAMPVMLGGERIGNVFTGQFFFEDEEIDMGFFQAQAKRYGFPEQAYLQAVQAVPRHSRETVESALRFLTSLAHMLSRLSYSNFELTNMVQQHADLLEREREGSRRLRTLAEIEEVLTSSLDLSEVISLALKSAETHLGVAASSVWTLGDEDRRLTLVGSRGFPEDFAADFERGVSAEDPFPIARAARSRASILFERVDSDELHRPVRDAYARYGIELGSLAAVPLIARDSVIGAMTLAWSEERRFEEDDLTLLDTLASRFSVAMENARLFQSEHMIAETLQETLVVLPSHVPGVSFSRAYESATYESGRVGGDFVDVFHVAESIVGITLGDVSGKGLDAAVTTSLIRTTLRVHALDELPPAVVAEKANQVMRRFSDIESFVTLWFGLLDTATGHLRYVCAGHPPGLILCPDGTIRELECLDPILGAFDDARFFESQTILAAGDRLVLYSDGVTEARSPEGEFLEPDGLSGVILRHASEPTESLAQAIMSDVIAYSEGVLRDDAAILAVEPSGG